MAFVQETDSANFFISSHVVRHMATLKKTNFFIFHTLALLFRLTALIQSSSKVQLGPRPVGGTTSQFLHCAEVAILTSKCQMSSFCTKSWQAQLGTATLTSKRHLAGDIAFLFRGQTLATYCITPSNVTLAEALPSEDPKVTFQRSLGLRQNSDANVYICMTFPWKMLLCFLAKCLLNFVIVFGTSPWHEMMVYVREINEAFSFSFF